MKKKDLPKFVKLDHTALRLIGNKYYRDGGNWEVGYKIIDEELVSWFPHSDLTYLHKQPLIEITEEEWREDNGQYAPKFKNYIYREEKKEKNMAKLEITDDSINPSKYPIGVIIARMQVDKLHEAHIALIEKVIANHPQPILFLGVPRIPNSKKNPLDFETRYAMVKEQYPNLTILPLNDMRFDADWAKQIDGTIYDTFHETNGEINALLYGSRDSFIPHYKPYGKYATVELSTNVDISGTEIREKISKDIINSSDFRAGTIRANHLKWDITYPTVDVCGINENGELLLARKPNETLFRFVGGFVDPTDESLEAAAKREFSEETGGTLISNLKYITSSKVNDWRYQNLNDGIMTTLFLGTVHTTDVTPTDDIEELKFFNIQDDLSTEEAIREKIVPEHVDLMIKLINTMYSTLINDVFTQGH